MDIKPIEVGSHKAVLMRGHKSDYWQLRLSIDGKRRQISTKTKDEAIAKDFAVDWMMIAKGRLVEGRPLLGTSFKATAYKFLKFEEATKSASRNARHVKSMKYIVDYWLVPYFHEREKLHVEDIRAKHLDAFLIWRLTLPKSPTQRTDRPAEQTQKHYMNVMRRILKYAVRQEIIDTLPLFPEISLKGHVRGWFEPDEYDLLKKKSRERIKSAPHKRVRQQREYLHNYIIFAVGSGARASELLSLRHNGVERLSNYVRLTVSGKMGAHEITAMPSCRNTYEAILKHNKQYGISSNSDRLVFPLNPERALRALLKDADLYLDKLGRPRSTRNFRHTAIMYRILNSQDLNLLALADNLATSVATINKHYAEVSNRLNEPALLSMKKASL